MNDTESENKKELEDSLREETNTEYTPYDIPVFSKKDFKRIQRENDMLLDSYRDKYKRINTVQQNIIFALCIIIVILCIRIICLSVTIRDMSDKFTVAPTPVIEAGLVVDVDLEDSDYITERLFNITIKM